MSDPIPIAALREIRDRCPYRIEVEAGDDVAGVAVTWSVRVADLAAEIIELRAALEDIDV